LIKPIKPIKPMRLMRLMQLMRPDSAWQAGTCILNGPNISGFVIPPANARSQFRFYFSGPFLHNYPNEGMSKTVGENQRIRNESDAISFEIESAFSGKPSAST